MMDYEVLLDAMCKQLKSGNYRYKWYVIFYNFGSWHWVKQSKKDDPVYNTKWECREQGYRTAADCLRAMINQGLVMITDDAMIEYHQAKERNEFYNGYLPQGVSND